ncbi:acyl carrier protein [Hymenobacter taeanensis]|uniref:Acyl carrier protein n=1 Tax=Hymenobacter taeanensis TaxID=2735321 RepID=A0A6M6BFB0_9BACT|nr:MULTISPECIES: phosphopantetheine-binding protein [Hymenobacter]QJX46670.1 acyl carrier protein [Hymenobacter taeanensis]UOQ80533.1 phosphopantetheine-binding protein [Hymenobacter sp. 5414T-23]
MEQLVRHQVERMLRKKRHIPSLTFTPRTRLQEDIGLDSFDLIELAINLEHRFHIEIPDPELETLRTVQDVLNCVDTHLSPASASY